MLVSSFNTRPWNTILFPPSCGATITMSRPESGWLTAIPCLSRMWSCRLLNLLPIALEVLFIYLASLIHFKKAANSLHATYLLMAEQVIFSKGARTKLTSIRDIPDPPWFMGTAVFRALRLNTCRLRTTRTVGESTWLQILKEWIGWNWSGRPGLHHVLCIFARLCSGHLLCPLMRTHRCPWNLDCSSDPVGIHNLFHNSPHCYMMTMAGWLTIWLTFDPPPEMTRS